MHGMCGKCVAICGWLFLALGVVLLLQDLQIWNFWNISWYTGVILLGGLSHIGKSKCPNCLGATTKRRR